MKNPELQLDNNLRAGRNDTQRHILANDDFSEDFRVGRPHLRPFVATVLKKSHSLISNDSSKKAPQSSILSKRTPRENLEAYENFGKQLNFLRARQTAKTESIFH